MKRSSTANAWGRVFTGLVAIPALAQGPFTAVPLNAIAPRSTVNLFAISESTATTEPVIAGQVTTNPVSQVPYFAPLSVTWVDNPLANPLNPVALPTFGDFTDPTTGAPTGPCYAQGVNNAGRVSGYCKQTGETGARTAFWDPKPAGGYFGPTVLPNNLNPGGNAYAYGINNAPNAAQNPTSFGQIAGSATDNTGRLKALRWDPLPPPFNGYGNATIEGVLAVDRGSTMIASQGRGIDSAGLVAGGYSSSNTNLLPNAVAWEGPGSPLGDTVVQNLNSRTLLAGGASARSSMAYSAAISDPDLVLGAPQEEWVVGETTVSMPGSADVTTATLWFRNVNVSGRPTGTGIWNGVLLMPPPVPKSPVAGRTYLANYSVATGVSSRGWVVGYVLWSLSCPPGQLCTPYPITQGVVWTGMPGLGGIFAPTALTTVTPGWTIGQTFAVNGNGEILAAGTPTGGGQTAVVLRP